MIYENVHEYDDDNGSNGDYLDGLEVPEDALKVEDRFNEMPLIYSAIRINIDNIQEQLGHEFKCEFMSTKTQLEEELLRLVEKNDVPASVRVANCFFSNEL